MTDTIKTREKIEQGAKALEKAAKVFYEYADLHSSKNTPEGYQKAVINVGYAMEFDEAADELRTSLSQQPAQSEAARLLREAREHVARSAAVACGGGFTEVCAKRKRLLTRIDHHLAKENTNAAE